MAYIPVTQREEKKKGYTPVEARLSGANFDIGRTAGSTQMIATPGSLSPFGLVKVFGQGIGKGFLATGATIQQAPRAAYEIATNKPATTKGEFIVPSDDSLLSKITRGFSGTKGGEVVSMRKEGEALPGIREGSPLAVPVAAGLAVLDLTGAGGLKGLSGLSKGLKASDNVLDATRLLKGAGFADDITANFAKTFANLTDAKKIEETLLRMEKLQNSTIAKPKSYIPVAERVQQSTPVASKVRTFLTDAEDDIVGVELSKYDTKPLTVRKAGDQPRAQVDEIDLRIDDLKQKLENKGLTKQEYVEVNQLMTRKGVDPFNPPKLVASKSLPTPVRGEAGRFNGSTPSVLNKIKPRGADEAFGGVAGIEQDENGKIGFDPMKAAFGVAGMTAFQKGKKVFKAATANGDMGAEIKKVSNNLLKYNPGMRQVDAEAMARDVIENRKFKASSQIDEARKLENLQGVARTTQTPSALRPSVLPDTSLAKGLGKELDTISLMDSKPQSSKLSKASLVDSEVQEATYASNRELFGKKTANTSIVKESLGASVKSIGKGLDLILGTISTRLKNIDPSLKTAIRKYEFGAANAIQKDRKAVHGFLSNIRKLSTTDYADLDLALKNGDIAKISEVARRNGLEDELVTVRATLDDLYKRAEDVGYDIGYEKNYFPRQIKDAEGFLDYLQKGDDWSIIDEAIRAKETELSRYLSVDEKASLVNTLVRGYKSSNISLSETGAMKSRRIDLVDANLNQFYRDSGESLLSYIDGTNEAIEARKFFGKSNKADKFANVDDSIGSYILDLMSKGKIKQSQERELREILSARFNARGTSGAMTVYKNLAYIDTMGSFTSAITQIGDLAFALYKGGVANTVKSLGKAIVGKSEITRADIGIEKIAQEFEGSGFTSKAVDRVFRIVGLHKMDALGKETVINSSISKLRKVASNPTPEFINKLKLVFGEDEIKLTEVIGDLKSGKLTEDTKLLAFNELLDIQPVALSEMPEMYLRGGNGRIFYMLKTYTIKLFDVYRNDIFQQIASGNKVQGIKNLVYLTSALVAMNATADEIKDFILNRKTSLKDRTVDNVLKLAGFSKFTIYKARQEGIGSAVAKTILPPFKAIDAAYKDVTQGNEVLKSETIQSIPIGGKLYYWWFGKGADKTKKKSSTSSGIPKLPKLNLPRLPKLPQL